MIGKMNVYEQGGISNEGRTACIIERQRRMTLLVVIDPMQAADKIGRRLLPIK